MATTRQRTADAPDGDGLAAALREASFVHVVASADGDALAAGGLLARAAAATETPYQLSLVDDPAAATRRVEADDEATTTATLGVDPPGADAAVTGRPASVAAFDAAAELGTTPDAALALAGVIAAGAVPGIADEGRILDAARAAGATRRPGVGLTTDDADAAAGLAHSTLVHVEFSGSTAAAAELLAGVGYPESPDEDARRALASAVAVEVATEAPSSAAVAVERALRPVELTGAPFPTAAGYADVLDAAARRAPGTAAALALGHGDPGAALDAWRAHASDAHEAVRTADVARHSGVVAARVDGPVRTGARLLRDFCSPEPAALAVGDDAVALATATADAWTALDAATDGPVAGREHLAAARTGIEDDGTNEDGTDALVARVREAL